MQLFNLAPPLEQPPDQMASRPLLTVSVTDRFVGRPAEEPRRDDPLEEDRARQRLREGRVAVLLEPEGPGMHVGVGGVERRLRMRALEIGTDHRGIGERSVAVAEGGDLAERADPPVLGRHLHRNNGFELDRTTRTLRTNGEALTP